MEINWTNEAIECFRDTLRYWSKRNCNNDYSNKIIDEVEKTEVFLKENPMLLSKFVEEVKLYKILNYEREVCFVLRFYRRRKSNCNKIF